MDVSLSSRSHTQRSKRGISVTLSKQKNNMSFEKDDNSRIEERSGQKDNRNSFMQKAYELFNIKTENQKCKENNQKNKNTDVLEKQSQYQNQKQLNQCNKSVKSDYIATYFEKNSKKNEIATQSQRLDQQIRQLQLQIYNTRTKITHDKYLNLKQQNQNIKSKKTIKNGSQSIKKINNVNKQKIQMKKTIQKQKAVVNGKQNEEIKNRQNFNRHLKREYNRRNNQELMDVQSYQYQPSYSHNSSFYPPSIRLNDDSPPHPSYLRQMLKKPRGSGFVNNKISQFNEHSNTFKTNSFINNQTYNVTQSQNNFSQLKNEENRNIIYNNRNRDYRSERKDNNNHEAGERKMRDKEFFENQRIVEGQKFKKGKKKNDSKNKHGNGSKQKNKDSNRNSVRKNQSLKKQPSKNKQKLQKQNQKKQPIKIFSSKQTKANPQKNFLKQSQSQVKSQVKSQILKSKSNNQVTKKSSKPKKYKISDFESQLSEFLNNQSNKNKSSFNKRENKLLDGIKFYKDKKVMKL